MGERLFGLAREGDVDVEDGVAEVLDFKARRIHAFDVDVDDVDVLKHRHVVEGNRTRDLVLVLHLPALAAEVEHLEALLLLVLEIVLHPVTNNDLITGALGRNI